MVSKKKNTKTSNGQSQGRSQGRSVRTSSQDKLYQNKKKTSQNKKAQGNKKHSTKKNRKQIKNKKRSLLGSCLNYAGLAAIWGIGILIILVIFYSHDLPDVQKLIKQGRTAMVTINASSSFGHDNTSRILTKYGDMHGEYVRVEALPKHLIQAVIATEDRRFFEHSGIDYMGLIRALYQNFRAKRIVQGGSTITQQLAKNMFLSSDRTIKRKVQELLLAFWLEHYYSKNDILSFYLNHVYFGGGNYGIDAASHFYFNKPATEISLGEAAIITGLLKAPSKYAPIHRMDKTQKRAKQVLINMYHAGYLTKEQLLQENKKTILIQKSGRGVLQNPYFADWVMHSLSGYIGNMNQDMVVESTLDPYLQQVAEILLEKYLAAEGAKRNISQGALVAMKPDGSILAMVGGRKYSKSQFNRATNAYRQSGSAFKFFLYLAAFEQGKTPDTRYKDQMIVIKGWSPKNYSRKSHGIVTLRQAFARSINTVAVRLAQEIGIDRVIQTALDLGISSKLNKDLSLALGTAFSISIGNGSSLCAYC